MSCNCKRKGELEDTYGTPADETFFEKIARYGMKVVMFLILILLSVVVIPTVVLVFIYKAAFTNNMKITLPQFMGKYMRDGQILQNTH